MSEPTKKRWLNRHRHDAYDGDIQLAVLRTKKEVKYARDNS